MLPWLTNAEEDEFAVRVSEIKADDCIFAPMIPELYFCATKSQSCISALRRRDQMSAFDISHEKMPMSRLRSISHTDATAAILNEPAPRASRG